MTTTTKTRKSPKLALDMTKKLLIGLVSKVEHATSHAQALEAVGMDVEILGGEIRSIPPRIDVVVVRTQSCSHHAQDVAQAWARKTKKKYICTNSLSVMLNEISAYRASVALDVCVDVAKDRAGLQEADVKHLRRVLDVPGRLVTQSYLDIGFFHPDLANCDVERLVAFLAPHVEPYKAALNYSESNVKALHALLGVTLNGLETERRLYMAARMVESSKGEPLPGNVPAVGSGAMAVMAAPYGDDGTFLASDIWRSEQKHRLIVDFLNEENAKCEEERQQREAALAAEAAAPQPEPEPEPELELATEPEPELESEPEPEHVHAAEPAMNPEQEQPSPAHVAQPLPVRVAPVDPLRDVEDAIRLLHECMRAASVSYVCIHNGEVTLTYQSASAGVVENTRGDA